MGGAVPQGGGDVAWACCFLLYAYFQALYCCVLLLFRDYVQVLGCCYCLSMQVCPSLLCCCWCLSMQVCADAFFYFPVDWWWTGSFFLLIRDAAAAFIFPVDWWTRCSHRFGVYSPVNGGHLFVSALLLPGSFSLIIFLSSWESSVFVVSLQCQGYLIPVNSYNVFSRQHQ